jgi:hypothetical protein
VYDVFKRIVAEGHRIDVLDSWNGEDLEKIRSIEVPLSTVPRDAFRFFEGFRFNFLHKR